MNPPTGTIGKYQIIREIARSNDIVYEAYDPLMNRRVALKELNQQSGSSDQQKEERVRRFQREAKAAGMLVHPNIVTIFEVGEDQGRYYIAMEYLEGETLRARIDRGFMDLDEAMPAVRQILEALAFAHQHSVVHRDIKPDNIFLLPDGRIKLTDFGIARLTFEPSITIDGQIFGTPSYMSPEQVIGKEIDTRSDIFSIGVLFYEMLTGSKPFFGDSVVTITYNIMNTEMPSPPGVPYPIEQVLRKALEKSPDSRYRGAQEMLDDLRIAEQQLQQGVAAPLPTYDPSAYDPYAQPAYGSYPYAQGQQTGYPQVPAYVGQTYQGYPGAPYSTPTGMYPPQGYPQFVPPPRKPLLSPQARVFLGQFIGTILIGFALLGGIGGIGYGIMKAYDNYTTQAYDEQLIGPVSQTAERLANEGQNYLKRQQYDLAEQRFQAAAKTYEEVLLKLKSNKFINSYTHNLSVCYFGLSDALLAQHQYDKSLTTLQYVLDIETRPTQPTLTPADKASTFNRLAIVNFQIFQNSIVPTDVLDNAIEYWRKALTAGDTVNMNEYRNNLAMGLYRRGVLYQNTMNIDKAITDFQEAQSVAPEGSKVQDACSAALENINRQFSLQSR